MLLDYIILYQLTYAKIPTNNFYRKSVKINIKSKFITEFKEQEDIVSNNRILKIGMKEN